MLRLLFLLAIAVAPAAVFAAQPLVPAEIDGVSVTTTVIAEGLNHPLFLTSPPGDPRLFVVEKGGLIRIIKDGTLLPEPFLDLSGTLATDSERGLLGLAFDPGYASNGRFFIDYTPAGPGSVAVASLKVSDDPDRADPASLTGLISIDHPEGNHNGGWLGFGPEGDLYVAVGDGGGAGDIHNYAQTTGDLRGKILRLDVRAGTSYAIPPGNPFAKGGGAPEVFAYGLRNPWRPSFDGTSLYIADVGQERIEEVDVISTADAGVNLGWHKVEGNLCYIPIKCDLSESVAPVYTYEHDGGTCSITGGYVYRGRAMPALDGRYFFGDYCTGVVSSFRYADGKVTGVQSLGLHFNRNFLLTSFGIDRDGEIYLVLDNGIIEKIVPAGT